MLKKIICLILVGGSAFATPEPPMTWEMAVKEAVLKNPDISVAVEAVRSAEAQYKLAYTNFFPQLSASLGFTQASTGVSNTAGTSGAIISTGPAPGQGTSVGTWSAGITATQSIFNGFQDEGKVRQGKANLDAAEAALAIAKFTLSSNLKSAFAQLLYAQDAVALAKLILERQQRDLRLVTLNFEGGQENRGNMLYQAATVSQAKYQWEHSIRQKKVAIKQLVAYLGRPAADNVDVKGSLDVKAPQANLDFSSLATHHPSHNQVVYQKMAAEAGIEVADQGWYPNLSANAFVGRTGQDFFPNTEHWSVGISLAFPFFPGTSNIFNSQYARAQLRQAEFTQTSTDNKLISAMETAYGNLVDAVEQVKVADEFVQAAKARSIIANEKYGTGLMTFDDWTVIETDLINRQQTLLQSQLTAKQAEASWENALGIGDIP